MNRLLTRSVLVSSVALVVACGGQKPEPATPTPVASAPAPKAPTPPQDPLATPPAAGITPSLPFPTIVHRTLPNGLALRIVPRKSYPVVELRLVVLSGQSSDGEKPGVAAFAGELMKTGGAGRWNSRELVEQAESLGSSLNVFTDRDATRVNMGVTSADLEPALAILNAVVHEPRFPADEFKKLKQQEIDRVKSSARGSAGWAASFVLYRELFELPTGVHPYSHYDALPAELEKLTLADAKDWHKRNVTPENAVLVVTGDVDPDAVEAAAKKAFAKWKGPRPEPVSISMPERIEKTEIYVADRPGSAQSQILVGTFGPERTSKDFPALATANQILGGGVSGRLFLDVREKRSLAYNTGSSVEEPANGPIPIVLSAGTQTPKTAEAVAALLEHAGRIASSQPSEKELESAQRQLSDSFLFRMETAGSIADLTSKLVVLKLPDDYYDEYRKAVGQLDGNAVSVTAQKYYQPAASVVVVAGDAASIVEPLKKLAPVTVLDPEKGFAPR
jgi:predicted Zn-dependent peptidase